MVVETHEKKIREGYKQTEVGVIPEDWEVVKISDVAEVKTGPFGSALHEKDYVLDGTPIITVEHLGERGVTYQNLPMVSDTDKSRLKAYVLRKGDIAFSRVGSIDRNALISDKEEGWLFSGRLLRVRLKPAGSSPSYLSYHFHSIPFKRRVFEVAVGQTMPSLNTEILKGIYVVLPSKKEQTAIASVLSDVDTLIEKLEKLIAKKRLIKQGAMQELLTGKLRLPGFGVGKGYKQTGVGRSPEDWEVKEFGEVVNKIVGGGTPSRSNASYWNGKIPWVTVKDFATFDPNQTQESITKYGLSHSATHLIPKGTLITSTRMALGKAVIYNVDVAINQDMKAIFAINKISTKFLYYWFQNNAQSINDLGSGSTVKGVSLQDIKKITFIKPQKEEQTAIASVLSDMDTGIEALEKKLTKYRLLKQGKMQVLLTGKIRLVTN
jgi:type I restriction enzyme, S subunit